MLKGGGAKGDGTADDDHTDDIDVHPSMKRVIAMMLTRSMRKSAREEVQRQV